MKSFFVAVFLTGALVSAAAFGASKLPASFAQSLSASRAAVGESVHEEGLKERPTITSRVLSSAAAGALALGGGEDTLAVAATSPVPVRPKSKLREDNERIMRELEELRTKQTELPSVDDFEKEAEEYKAKLAASVKKQVADLVAALPKPAGLSDGDRALLVSAGSLSADVLSAKTLAGSASGAAASALGVANSAMQIGSLGQSGVMSTTGGTFTGHVIVGNGKNLSVEGAFSGVTGAFSGALTGVAATFSGLVSLQGQASTTQLSVFKNFYAGGTATTSIDSTGYLSATRLSVSTTTATSTFASGGFAIDTDKFIVQQTSGNVGIGTTSPYAKLSVHALTSDSSSHQLNPLFVIASSTPTATTTHFSINRLGNVAFGAVGGFSDVPVKITDPGTLPPGLGNGASFSPDGTYLVVSHSTSPFITIYKRSGDTFTKLADPATSPVGGAGANSPSFSPDGNYLSIGHASSPFITIYKRSGDTFTKLADPATLPAGTGNETAFSSDGTYLAIAHDTSPFITIYKRSGDTFTKLANPVSLPAGSAFGATFSPDGTYLVVGHASSPFITIYKRSGDTFTKLANPATLPAWTGFGLRFSPDGTYFAVAHPISPFVTIYKRSGDTFTKLADPATLPAGSGTGVSFSPDGTYLAVSHGTSPYISIYKRSGDTFTKIANPATLPANNGQSATYSPDGTYLAVSHVTSPFITIYKGSGGAIHRTELVYGDTSGTGATSSRTHGLGIGKEISLYRSAPGTLALGSGASLDIQNGQLRMGGSVVIDPTLAGFFTSLGVGTSSPYAALSIEGSSALGNSATAGYFTATTSTASTFPYASTTMITATTASTTNLTVSGMTAGSLWFAGTSGVLSQNNANLFWDNTNTRLGIGTTTPNQRLSLFANAADSAIEFSTVSGANEKWTIGIDDSDVAKFKIASSSVLGTNDRFVIDGNGNVGIGTSSPERLLHVYKNTTDTTTPLLTIDNPALGGVPRLRFQSLDGANLNTGSYADVYFDAGNGSLNLLNNTSYLNSGINFFTSESSSVAKMVIDNGGKVGIGTTSPTGLLTLASTTAAQLSLSAGAGVGQWAFRNAGGNLYFATTTVAGTATTSTSALTIIGSSGNVGIGTTTPWAQLSVNPNGISGPAFVIGSSTATRFIVTNGGRVGIGTVTPLNPLSVRRDSGSTSFATEPAMAVLANLDNATSTLSTLDFVSFDGVIPVSTGKIGTVLTRMYGSGGIDADLLFGTTLNSSLNERMRITSAGNIGIGTTTPQWLLNPTSASASQLALSAGAGVAQWAFRNAGGNLYFATTTVAGTATTSTSALTIIGSNGRVGINLVSGAQPATTLDVAGTIFADTIGAATSSPWRTFGVTGTVGLSSTLSAEAGSDNYLCIDPITYEVTDGGANCGASSERYKKNIEMLGYGLAELLRLRPVSYFWKEEIHPSRRRQVGLIAEEVEAVLPEVIGYKDGLVDSVNYEGIIPLLVKAVQEQNRELQSLRASIGASTMSITSSGDLVAQTLKVTTAPEIGSADAPAGITLYDQLTRTPQCLVISGGLPQVTAGKCGVVTATSHSTEATVTATTTPADTQPPVITILGNSTAELHIGDSFIDPGTTVADNVDHNLSVTIAGDAVDTAHEGPYRITYDVTDNAGNHAVQVVRTVNVRTPTE